MPAALATLTGVGVGVDMLPIEDTAIGLAAIGFATIGLARVDCADVLATGLNGVIFEPPALVLSCITFIAFSFCELTSS